MVACPNILPYGGLWTRSEVVISVDFGLLDPRTRLTPGVGPIAIYPSLSNITDINTDQVIADVTPFPLPPGGNYIATVSVRGRSAVYGLKKQLLAILGFFDSPDVEYLVPHIAHVVPLLSSASSPNISTLHLLCGFDTREFRVDMDTREKSVANGFATVGGFWTAISGVFAVIFGTTLLRIFFGTKVLSIFGLVQRWEKNAIVKAYLDEYPQLREEKRSTNSQRGVVAVMQDHLLDMELFKQVVEAEERANSEVVASVMREKEEGNAEQVHAEGVSLLANSGDAEKERDIVVFAENHS